MYLLKYYMKLIWRCQRKNPRQFFAFLPNRRFGESHRKFFEKSSLSCLHGFFFISASVIVVRLQFAPTEIISEFCLSGLSCLKRKILYFCFVSRLFSKVEFTEYIKIHAFSTTLLVSCI